MTEVLQITRFRSAVGPRRVAGTYDCSCPRPYVLVVDSHHAACGHCEEPFHQWSDGDLVGLEIVCEGGVLTIRLVDFEATLHRCGDDDVLSSEIESALQLMLEAVPA